jgi:hypothetical protein
MIDYFIDVIFGYLTLLILILGIWCIVLILKKQHLHTINFKLVFLLSLISALFPTANLLSGKYKIKASRALSVRSDKNRTMKMSDSDRYIVKSIFQISLSSKELDKATHDKFYAIADKYKMGQTEVDALFTDFGKKDLDLLIKSFYADALKTLQTGQISESQNRRELEDKFLNEAQKARNKEYLRKILAGHTIDIDGKPTLLTREECQKVLNNLDYVFAQGKKNIDILRDRSAFK